MTINSQDIGPYRVEAEIGRGGMGVVYRAVDTRLGRTVAIKALPDDLADDAERLARFEREARTMAALNHPNVAGIHGVEAHEGRKYLVLEYVDGETLAERLDRGPLPIDEALDVCAQIAAGIDAAHQAGIIHRDLKPANVKLTPDGKVKVLDFGLAKAAETHTSSVDVTQTPTITGVVTPQSPTVAGVILGTAPYMSPEQARGRPVDRRSDVWSFGVVLYECLTGISPFVGETVSDSIAAILQNEADLDRLPPAAPSQLRRVLQRCLERDRDRRFRDIGDVRLELLEVREGGYDEAPPPVRVPGRSWWAALAALLAAAVALMAWMGTRPRETPMRLVADIVPQDPGAEISVRSGPPAISPDGSRLAYAVERGSEMSLVVRDLGTGAESNVATGEEISGLFWSPDSRSLGFFESGRMLVIPPGGARPEPVPGVAVQTRRIESAAWAADGTIVYGRVPEGLTRVRPFEGEPELLLDPYPDRFGDRAGFPSFLPDGRRFLFEIFESESEGTSGVYLGSLDSREFSTVLPVASNAVYSPPGWLMFSRAGNLQAQPFDATTGRVEGEPIVIANDVRPISWPPHGLFAVSNVGRIAYVRGSDGASESEFVWVDRSSGEMTPVGVEGSLWNPELSPDGRFLAFDSTTRETQGDIWVRDLARGFDTQLTDDPRNESQPVWMPDDSAVIFFRGNDLYRIAVDGNSEAELLFRSEESTSPWGVTPDGSTLLFQANDEGSSGFVWTLDLVSLEAKRWSELSFGWRSGSMSPDGRWVAYGDPVQDRLEVFIRSYPGGEVVHRVSIDGGSDPRWSRDGTEIYFAVGSRLMAAGVRRRTDGSVEIDGRPQQIGTLPPSLRLTKPFDAAPDGTRFLATRSLAGASRSVIRLVDHWD